MKAFIANNHAENADLLVKHLIDHDEEIEIVGKASTYQETLDFVKKNQYDLDVVFCSAALNDQHSCDIAAYLPESSPLIFTSTEKQHAYDAFRANAFDFLLEPFDCMEVKNVLNKWKGTQTSLHKNEKAYKKRFLIKFGDKIQFRHVDDISYIYAEGKMAYIFTKQPKRKFIIDYTLDELEKKLLDPRDFYRINRKYIVNIHAIEEARQYVNSRLKLILNPPAEADMIVSREKVHDFKKWLNL